MKALPPKAAPNKATIEIVDTIYGPVSVLSTDTTQGLWLKWSGAAAEDMHIEFVRNLLSERPRGIIIDVGASYGTWSMALADLAEGVIAIEPQSVIFELLAANLARVESLEGKRQAWHCAAWDRHATLHLPAVDYDDDQLYGGNFGGVSLKDRNPRGDPIEALPLDDLTPRGVHVSFIKADVEGAEREVILGAMETIRRCRPILFVESRHEFTDYEGLRQQIESLSYVVQDQGPNFICLPLSS